MGLTLVEVVAGLALLSTLLVAVLTTKARVTRQWSGAHRRLEAVAAADRLLADWWQDRLMLPRRSAGRVPGDAGLGWRTTPVRNDAADALAASVVRLDIFDARAISPASSPGVVLASVEILLDDNEPPPNSVAQTIVRGDSP